MRAEIQQGFEQLELTPFTVDLTQILENQTKPLH
jgi:hypothetical protein